MTSRTPLLLSRTSLLFRNRFSGSRRRGGRLSGSRSATVALTLLSATLLAVPNASAHELYLQPSSQPGGEAIVLELRLGHAFMGEAVPRLPNSFLALERYDAAGERVLVPGAWQVHPAGFLRHQSNEPLLFVYRSKPIPHHLAADRFERYLEEEGLDAVRAARAAAGTTGEGGRELYSRCAKALHPRLQTRSLPPTANRSSGCRLELTLAEGSTDAAASPGDWVPSAIVRFDGQPAPGLLMRHSFLPRNGGSAEVRTQRTDAQGRVALGLAEGKHLLNVVHAVPAVERDFEWRSYWSSLSFELTAEPDGSTPATSTAVPPSAATTSAAQR